MKYLNLVIDNRSDSTDRLYTYGCRGEAETGSKVYVPFARGNRLREAYVASVCDDIDDEMKKKLKYVEKTDEDIYLSEEIMRTARWMKDRYLCRYIDGIRCFIPAGSKAKRRTVKDPFEGEKEHLYEAPELTERQSRVLEEINTSIEKGVHDRFLLHGVTGSGKTEVYMRAAEKTVSLGRNVIILVPEISLTGQIIDRFIGRFGSRSLAVLHSRLTAGERYDQWQRIRKGEVRIVIGARSAVFAPLENIGLIVIDEEHETTYKSDHTPKYDTAEVAIKRTADRDNNGVLLLGSATPSVVTYRRAEEGIYRLLTLDKRYNENRLPKVSIADMREELKAGNKSIISRKLFEAMKECLDEDRQVMLFLNRRGYSTFISCRECGYVAKCPHCGLSLTYHKASDGAVCHYCGYQEKAPRQCPECGSRYVRYFGTGTEKVEETIAEMFPDISYERLDLDTVKKRGELDRKLKSFRTGKTRILIGTQIIAKGLDFKNVGLVGIISADVSLNIPDFRSPERTFQLITQAAGRAGRGDEEGRVVIQTYSPEHYAVIHAAEQDYRGFYQMEISLREFMGYPPFSDLYQIIFTADSYDTAREGALSWYQRLTGLMNSEDAKNVFEPQEAYLGKIKDIYRFSMLVKCPRGRRREYSGFIEHIREEDRKNRKKKYTAVVDINPYSFV